MRRWLGSSAAVVAAVTIAVSALGVPSAGAAATVLKDGSVGCYTSNGDVPGAPGISMPRATLVLRPNGGASLSCHGWLPARVHLARTFSGSAPCHGPTGVTTAGHVVATRSGRVTFSCRFPAGTFPRNRAHGHGRP